MAQKNEQNQPGQEAGLAPEGSPRSDEFEDAVTTEISDVLAKAFDEKPSSDPGDVHVTDMQLTSYVDPEADEVLSPGFLLSDRFEIVELVHSGGMSHVYKAVDRRRHPEGSGEIHVAIKMMRPSVASQDQARLSLEREAAKAQSLSHPNVINIFDFDDHEGQFFLVMEWLEGESVNALLRRTRGERIAPRFAWSVIAGTAAGVQHAHQKEVVHADINPSNIFITGTQEIKLLDFGVARYTSSPEHAEDERFAWVTQPYASPEVLSGLPPVFEDDVFSLACVAYRLLSGKHPFGGRLSLVAKHQGRSVEPIPGLPDEDWRLLRRALSYERSDRPGSASEFVARGANAGGVDESGDRLRDRLAALPRTPLAAIAAVVIVTGGFWLFQRGADDQAERQAEPSLSQETAATEPVDTPPVSPAEALLAEAARAVGEGQFVYPAEANARALFREVLVLEPDNADALRGLRAISNDFVQQANQALSSGDPVQAYAALTVANETDPANPATEIVSQLIVTKGNGELADARLAAATGNLDAAEQGLSRAEQYAHIDPAEVRSIRRQIRLRRQSGELLERLSAADAHIAAGRLLSPEEDNAHVLLLDLYAQHGGNARLLASMERLGERLLTRSAFAVAAGRVAEANELLDAVEALGVLTSEVESARVSLGEAEGLQLAEVAEEQSDEVMGTDELQLPQVAEAQPDEVARSEDAQGPQAAEEQPDDVAAAENVSGPEVDEAQSGDALLLASAVEPVVTEEPIPDAAPVESAAGGAEPEVRRMSLQELGITDYVAPKFPRRAVRRRVSGMVEVEFNINTDGSTDSIRILQSTPGELFVESATEAVRQWRFATRDETVPAQITLRFDQAQ